MSINAIGFLFCAFLWISYHCQWRMDLKYRSLLIKIISGQSSICEKWLFQLFQASAGLLLRRYILLLLYETCSYFPLLSAETLNIGLYMYAYWLLEWRPTCRLLVQLAFISENYMQPNKRRSFMSAFCERFFLQRNLLMCSIPTPWYEVIRQTYLCIISLVYSDYPTWSKTLRMLCLL